MKRLAVAAALVGAGVVPVRALQRTLHARMRAACKGLPPKLMMAGIEEIRANSARTHRHTNQW